MIDLKSDTDADQRITKTTRQHEYTTDRRNIVCLALDAAQYVADGALQYWAGGYFHVLFQMATIDLGWPTSHPMDWSKNNSDQRKQHKR